MSPPYVQLEEKPPFSLSDLRDAVPSHCWERPLWKSFFFLFRDLASIGALYVVAYMYGSGFFFWTLFGMAQGCLFFGPWIIGHECGHRAFAEKVWINDLVGEFTHGLLLTPFHSWRITHATHHANTGHMTKDTAFAPDDVSVAKGIRRKLEFLAETPIFNALYLFAMMFVGMWFYLGWNAGGQKAYKKLNSHFWAASPDLFKPENRRVVNQSVSFVVCFALILLVCSVHFGFKSVFCYYLYPYLCKYKSNQSMYLYSYLFVFVLYA